MKRNAILLRSDKGDAKKGPGKINIYIDELILGDLIEFGKLQSKMIILDRRLDAIVKDCATKDIFCTENFKDGIDVWALRLIKKNKFNDRFYCKKYDIDAVQHIVIGHIFIGKKVQGLNDELRNIISKVNEYEYKFEN